MGYKQNCVEYKYFVTDCQESSGTAGKRWEEDMPLRGRCTHATKALPLIYVCCTDYQLDFFEHTLTDAPTAIPWSSPGSCLILSSRELMYRTCNRSLCGCSFSININRAVIFEYVLPTTIWIYLNMHKYFFQHLVFNSCK